MGCGGSKLIAQNMCTNFHRFHCIQLEKMNRCANPRTLSTKKHAEDDWNNHGTILNPIGDVDVDNGGKEKENKGQKDDIGCECLDREKCNQEFLKEDVLVVDVINKEAKDEKEMEEEVDEMDGDEPCSNEVFVDPPSFKVYCLDNLYEDFPNGDPCYSQADNKESVTDRESISSNQISTSKLSKKWKRATRLKNIFNTKGRRRADT